MITKTKVTWYIGKRGVLLAKQFLLELEPQDIIYLGDSLSHSFDYMALFLKSDGSLLTIGIEVKATEKQIKNVYDFQLSAIKKLKQSNIPVLIVVIDVKRNLFFFNWVKKVVASEEIDSSNLKQFVSVPLRQGTPEEIQNLKQQIMETN